ncbi:MAG: CpsD/CapB family tyrosine-protein kinase [Candidatus Sulfotelmatobacter sp.]
MSRILDALDRSREEEGCDISSSMAEEFADSGNVPREGLGSVPSVQPAISPQGRLEALTHPNEFAAEQFRMLGARLQNLAETRALKTLLITSASFREGKSLVSLNLAVTLAQRAGKKVLLVEGDLRKPALSQMLGLPTLKGLSDWVSGDQAMTNYLYRLAALDLWLMPAGESCAHPLAAIQSERLRQLPTQAARYFDWIVIDSCPLMLADASILSRLADGTLVVARQESTPKKSLQKSIASLERVLGFVLNDATSIGRRDYAQYYIPAATGGKESGRKSPSEMPPASAGSSGANAVAS